MIRKICCSGTSSSWEVEVTCVILPYLTFFSNGFLNNVLLDFFSFFHKQEKSWNGIFISCKSINKMNATNPIFWSWFPRSFLSNGSCLTAFIHASLSYLHLMGPGKACKWWFIFKTVSSLLAVTFSFKVVFCASFFFPFINFISTIWTANNTTIYFWHDERYVLKTRMIWKLRLAFDVYTSFPKVIWKKAQHYSEISTPLTPASATHLSKNKMAHSYGKQVYSGQNI